MPIAEALISGELDFLEILAATSCAQIVGARGDDDTLDDCRAVADRDGISRTADARASVMSCGPRRARARGVARGARPRRAGPRRSSVSGESLAEAYAILAEAALSRTDDAAIDELLASRPHCRRRVRPLAARLRCPTRRRAGAPPGRSCRLRAPPDRGDRAAVGRSGPGHCSTPGAARERSRRRADPDALAEARDDLHRTRRHPPARPNRAVGPASARRRRARPGLRRHRRWRRRSGASAHPWRRPSESIVGEDCRPWSPTTRRYASRVRADRTGTVAPARSRAVHQR